MFGGPGLNSLDSEKARDVFFRVTGKPFNSLKPSAGSQGGLGRGDAFGNFEFDDHLGGDEVAVCLKNLDLSESRFDGHVDSASRIGYGEWTMVFKNSSAQPNEGLILLLADDHARRVTTRELENYPFIGGRDNEPALREGLRLARESGAPIVWVHGPQAVGLSQSEALLQQIERGTIHPVIYEIEAVAGPNRLSEAIYRTGCIKRGPLLLAPERDFSQFLKKLQTEHPEAGWTWKRSGTSENLPGTKVWDNLARLWAVSAAEAAASPLTDAARAELAARYQLVTLFSGAVVLETQQQYADHGLTPADGSATPNLPSVPEPSTSLLVILATAAAMLRRKREA